MLAVFKLGTCRKAKGVGAGEVASVLRASEVAMAVSKTTSFMF